MPYGAEGCWACGGPTKRIEQRPPGASNRTFELVSGGATTVGAAAYFVTGVVAAAAAGAVVGAGVVGGYLGMRHLIAKRRAARELAAGNPVRLLGTSATDDANRVRLDQSERECVAMLAQIADGLRANAVAVAARGSSSAELDQARHALEEVRGHYEGQLANTLVGTELVVIAGWLRRMSAYASLPIADAEQARAVIVRFDQELAAARTPTFARRAQVTAGAEAMVVTREGRPPIALPAAIAATLPPRFAEPWTRAVESAATLRTLVADALELVAVRAAADIASRTRLIENPEAPELALTATANVVGSLEDEVARLLEETDRVRAEADALREVDATLAR